MANQESTQVTISKSENSLSTMFQEEGLKQLIGFQEYEDHIEVECECTSQKYGDNTGILKVYRNGRFQIACQCTPGCTEDNLSPHGFVKHCGRQGNIDWKSHIWLMIDYEKVPIKRTPLFKYYRFASNEARSSQSKRTFHHDEFISCFRCNKERRFLRRTKEQCRMYHDALATENWRCSMWPFGKITCEDVEERACRKRCRGCLRTGTCKGCTTCVCNGCFMCRFQDCNCRTCVDFMQNGIPN